MMLVSRRFHWGILSVILLSASQALGGDPSVYYEWEVSYREVSPLGVKQKVWFLLPFFLVMPLMGFLFFILVIDCLPFGLNIVCEQRRLLVLALLVNGQGLVLVSHKEESVCELIASANACRSLT